MSARIGVVAAAGPGTRAHPKTAVVPKVLLEAGGKHLIVRTIELMRDHGVRRVPVVDADGILVGLFASDDALELLTEQLHHLVRLVVKQQRQEYKRRPPP